SETGLKYWVSEQSPAMETVGHVPPWNTMAVAHDKLVIVYHLGDAASVASIVPAIVITYAGTGAGVYSEIQNAVIQSANLPKQAKPVEPRTVANCMVPQESKVAVRISVEFPNEPNSPNICEVTKEWPK